MNTTDSPRVVHIYGWDLLRGVCAFSVAIYHLLDWTGVATLSAIGSYAVYIFFILSGASLTHTYKQAWAAKNFHYVHFLLIRYARLAPLYLVLLFTWLAIKPHPINISPIFFLDAIKNATLLFGFHYPTWHSWLIGGWSIGIEFIFYLSFPAFLAAINTKPKQFAITAAFLTLLHFAWIHFTVTPSSFSPDGYNGNAALYHHPQAFSLYFFIGCFLGSQSTQTVFAQSSVIPMATILGGFGLLLAFTPDVKGHEITGWRGVIFPCVCIAMVYASGKINFCDKAKKLATILGATTYGLYLIHPIIYFTIAWHLIPQLSIQPQDVSFREKIDVIAFVLITSVALSIISDKAFEAPIRRRVKTWVTRKKQ